MSNHLIPADASPELLQLRADYVTSLTSPDAHGFRNLRVWPEEAQRNGVVERAMALCAGLLAPEAARAEYVTGRPFERLLVMEGTMRWRGLRVTIAGFTDDKDLSKDELIADLRRLARSALVICVLPSSFFDWWQEVSGAVRSTHHLFVPVFPLDVTALADRSWNMDELLDFKLYRSTVLDKQDIECQFDGAIVQEFVQSAARASVPQWRDLTQVVSDLNDEGHWIEHPRLESVVQSLREANDCLLVGPSSSGKSTLAYQSGRRLQQSGYEVEYIDVGGMPAAVASRAFTWLLSSLATPGQKLLILDDLQSSPSAARYLLWLLVCFRSLAEFHQPSVLALTWPSYRAEAAQELDDAHVVYISAGLVRPLLLARVLGLTDSHTIKSLEDLAGDDLVVWRLILDGASWKIHGLNRADLAQQVWTARIRAYNGDLSVAKMAVFIASVLGRYELELPEGFLTYESGASSAQIGSLCSARLLRRNGNKIVAGHRSLCTLLADWLARDRAVMERFAQRHPSLQPADLVLAYIRGLDSADIWPVLRTLYVQVGFRGHAATTQRAEIFVEFWKALDALIERIAEQSGLDPTWGNILSNALFAIEGLCGVGKREQARPSIEFMRAHWRLERGAFYVLGGTVERLDFDKIAESMWREDAELGLSQVPAHQSAGDIDKDRFHQTWVGGLVLCAEAAFRELPRNRLHELASAVERLQSEPGYFYPQRVPWCTARVLTGLARCGHTYFNSPAVRKACDWLLRPAAEGGPRNQAGVWPSGTDGWNSVLETTAMCATALVLAGIDLDDPRLAPAVSYITEHRSEWISDGRWLDGAWELAAFVTVGGSWRSVTEEIFRLLKEARREAFWGGATLTATESLKQSCDVGTVADYLVGVVWSSLRAELPEFLETFAVPALPFPVDDGNTRDSTFREPAVGGLESQVGNVDIIGSQESHERHTSARSRTSWRETVWRWFVGRGNESL